MTNINPPKSTKPSTSKSPTVEELQARQAFKELYGEEAIKSAELQTQITTLPNTLSDEEKLQELFSNAKSFVAYVLDADNKNGKRIQCNLCSSSEARQADAQLSFIHSYKELYKKADDLKIKPRKETKLTDKEIRLAISQAKPKIVKTFKDLWNSKYKFDPKLATDDHIKLWVWSLTPTQNELDIAVMKHWMWQVKRQAKGEKVINPIMPIFYSKKGGEGKSWQIEKLIKPVADINNNMFVIPSIKMSYIDNDNFPKMLENKLICFFDEMSQISKPMLEDLNRIISGGALSCKLFYTQDVVTPDNHCSFITTTNRPLKALISLKSQRRYYQVTCEMDETIRSSAELQREYWEQRNQLIDYTIMWKSIDESLEEGYLVGDAYAKVQEIQNENINYNSIEMFLDAYCRRPQDFNGDLEIMAEDLYEKYKDWAISNFPDERSNIRVFGIHTSACNFVEKRRTNKGNKYVFNQELLPTIKFDDEPIEDNDVSKVVNLIKKRKD